MPAIAHYHDFSLEWKRFLINAIQDYLQYVFLPVLRSLRHMVNNSKASRQLSHHRGIHNVIIHVLPSLIQSRCSVDTRYWSC